MLRLSLLASILLAPIASAKDDFVPLFNGKDLTGWTATLRPPKEAPDSKPDPAKTFSVKDGILLVSGSPNGYLATEKEYADYTLKLQWRYPKGTAKPNSGVLFHLGKDDKVWPHGYEAQLKAGFAGDLWLNPDLEGKYPTLEVEAELKDAANKEGRHYFRIGKDLAIERELGEWNDIEIECQGDAISFTVNGKKANEAKKSSLKKGRIALQSEGSEVQFRNLEIRTGK